MAEPIITIQIRIKRISAKGTRTHKFTDQEKDSIDKFVKIYCRETNNYLTQRKIDGEIKYDIEYKEENGK